MKNSCISTLSLQKLLIYLVGIVIFVICIFLFAGAEEQKPLFTLVQLTDIHYTSNPPLDSGITWKHHIRLGGYKLHELNIAQIRQILENTITYINETIKPDMVVVTGDLVDRTNDKKSMKQVGSILDKLNSPWYPVMGDRELNKGEDRRRNFRKVFGDVNYSFNYQGWHIIMLGVFPDDDALWWLREDLDRNADKPTLVFTHQMLVASWLMRELAKRFYGTELISPGAEEIIEILNNHGNVVAVFCGHSHTNFSRKKGGILYISTTSLATVPYQFRVIRVYKDRVSTAVRTAHPLRKR